MIAIIFFGFGLALWLAWLAAGNIEATEKDSAKDEIHR